MMESSVIFSEALEYMSVEEYVDLCYRIICAYNKIKETKSNKKEIDIHGDTE